MYYGLKESFLVTSNFMWRDTHTGSTVLISKNTVLTIYGGIHNVGSTDIYSLTDGAHLFDMDENELEHYVKLGTLLHSQCNSKCGGSCNTKDSCDKDAKCCEPKNNDGRDKCYWCGKATVKIDSGFSFYDFCKKCQK